MLLYPVRAQSFSVGGQRLFPREWSLVCSSCLCSLHTSQNALAVSSPHLHCSWSLLDTHPWVPQIPAPWNQLLGNRKSLLLTGHRMGMWGPEATDNVTCHIPSLIPIWTGVLPHGTTEMFVFSVCLVPLLLFWTSFDFLGHTLMLPTPGRTEIQWNKADHLLYARHLGGEKGKEQPILSLELFLIQRQKQVHLQPFMEGKGIREVQTTLYRSTQLEINSDREWGMVSGGSGLWAGT